MTIAHFTDTFLPITGGVQTHISSIVGYMKELNFEIVTDAVVGSADIESSSNNCKIRRFGPRAMVTKKWNKIVYPQRLFVTGWRHERKIHWLNNSDVHVVHVHGPAIGMDAHKIDRFLGEISFTKRISFKALEKPRILTMHGLFSPYNESKFYAEFEKRLISEFKTIICVDKSIYNYVKEIARDSNVQYIPNSIDTQTFVYSKMPDSAPIKIAYIGRPDALRGFDLVREFAKVVPDGFELNLLLAGNQQSPIGIEESKHVKIRWNIQPEEIASYLRTFHVILNPIRIPVISRVALEAMSSGRPVIAIKRDDDYPIIHEKNGFLFDGSIASLQSLLLGIKDGRYDLESMGKAGRTLVEREYSFEAIMPKLQKIYANFNK